MIEADALLRVDEINEILEIDLSEDDAYDTLAGLILYKLRHIPEPGESITVGDYVLTVHRVDGPRITRVRISQQQG